MTTLRGNAGRVPAPAAHRPAAGASTLSPDGRPATIARRVARGLGREVLVFGAIGIVSTATYSVLYLLFRTATDATAANALALGITAVGNTAANRRLTFGIRGGSSMLRDQVGGLLALAVALAITTASVSLLAAVAPHAGHLVELAVLVVANALATMTRFVLLRSWIVTHRRPVPVPSSPSTNQE